MTPNGRSCTSFVINTTENKYIKFYGIFIGLNEATIRKYILDQEKEEVLEDKLTKKERYNLFKSLLQ